MNDELESYGRGDYGSGPVESNGPLRITTPVRMILRELLDAREPFYGREVAIQLDLAEPTVSRALDRFHENGWLQEVDNADVDRDLGDARPRRFFELTEEGRLRGEEAIQPRNFDRRALRPERVATVEPGGGLEL